MGVRAEFAIGGACALDGKLNLTVCEQICSCALVLGSTALGSAANLRYVTFDDLDL